MHELASLRWKEELSFFRCTYDTISNYAAEAVTFFLGKAYLNDYKTQIPLPVRSSCVMCILQLKEAKTAPAQSKLCLSALSTLYLHTRPQSLSRFTPFHTVELPLSKTPCSSICS